MKSTYLDFLPRGKFFYGIPDQLDWEDREPFQLDRSDPAWLKWSFSESEAWNAAWIPGVALPRQGWKIHVTATPENAQRILNVVAEFCLSSSSAFKYTPDREALTRKNGKLAVRTASGKFLTIYPTDDADLISTLQALEPQLKGLAGPAILGDLQWAASPLSVRYGGFAVQFTSTGERHNALPGNVFADALA